MPSQQYYNVTKIDPSKGERWFCTEQEAVSKRVEEGSSMIRKNSITLLEVVILLSVFSQAVS